MLAQKAMLDKDTKVIAYGRAKLKKQGDVVADKDVEEAGS